MLCIPSQPTTFYLSWLPHWWFVQFQATFVVAHKITFVIFLVLSSHFLCKEFLSSNMETHSFSSDVIFFKRWDAAIPAQPTTFYLSWLPHWWFVQWFELFWLTFDMSWFATSLSSGMLPWHLDFQLMMTYLE